MEKIPLPNKFELIDIEENKAKLVIEPLFSGYGTTIGNALRRVLLSSIPGAAIKAVKIKGVDHEFSTIDFVKEDVVDILLNLKKIRLNVFTDEDVRLVLKANGKKDVTAADIQANSDVEIISKDLHIATLTDDKASVEMEIIANKGRGFVSTEIRIDDNKEIGMIAVDSLYSPVVNVSLDVENVRVGQVTNFERVTLEIETDGVVTAKEAVAYASQILVDHFQLLVNSDLEPQTARTDIMEEDEIDKEKNEVMEEIEFKGDSEVEAPAPKKRGRPKKNENEEIETNQ